MLIDGINTPMRTELKPIKLKPKTKILIVEDNITYRGVWERYFRDEQGCMVLGAANSEECDVYLEDNPDIIILDFKLKGSISGLDILKKLRNDQNNVPVIMLTSYPDVTLQLDIHDIDQSVPLCDKKLFNTSEPMYLIRYIDSLLKKYKTRVKNEYKVKAHTFKINPEKDRIVSINNQEVKFSPDLFTLLVVLLRFSAVNRSIHSNKILIKLNKEIGDKQTNSLQVQKAKLEKIIKLHCSDINISNYSGGYSIYD